MLNDAITISFDCHGNAKQKDVWRLWADNTTSDIVYGGSKGSGKSYLGAGLIFGDALMYPETHYFIARKELNDIRRFTMPTIREVIINYGLHAGYLQYDGRDNFYTLPNGSKVFLISAKTLPSDPLFERFGSMQMTRGWIEEAGEFEVAAKNNLIASVGRWKNDTWGISGKVLQTCNPTKNYLYREYYKPFKAGKLDPWKAFIQAYPGDNKKLPAGYLENLQRTLSQSEKERLLFGNWEYDDDPAALMDYDSIISIFTNDHIPRIGKRFMTVDVARFGADKSIIRVWDGFRVEHKVIMEKCSTVQVADKVKELSRELYVPKSNIVIDEDGVGGGVVDMVPGARGFIANSKAFNKKGENYENLKSQCAYKLAEKVKNKEIYEQEPDPMKQQIIIEDLEQIKEKSVEKEGKRGIIPKDQVKEKLGRSPDDGDTYIMRMFFEVRPMGLRVV